MLRIYIINRRPGLGGELKRKALAWDLMPLC